MVLKPSGDESCEETATGEGVSAVYGFGPTLSLLQCQNAAGLLRGCTGLLERDLAGLRGPPSSNRTPPCAGVETWGVADFVRNAYYGDAWDPCYSHGFYRMPDAAYGPVEDKWCVLAHGRRTVYPRRQ